MSLKWNKSDTRCKNCLCTYVTICVPEFTLLVSFRQSAMTYPSGGEPECLADRLLCVIFLWKLRLGCH